MLGVTLRVQHFSAFHSVGKQVSYMVQLMNTLYLPPFFPCLPPSSPPSFHPPTLNTTFTPTISPIFSPSYLATLSLSLPHSFPLISVSLFVYCALSPIPSMCTYRLILQHTHLRMHVGRQTHTCRHTLTYARREANTHMHAHTYVCT